MTEKLYESVVCPSCGCLCDDIDVVVEDNTIKTIRNVCEWGINKFLFTKKFTSNVRRGRVERPMVKERSLVETDYETAYKRTVDILTRARKPLVYGLTNSGYNAQKIALQIAKRLNGLFEPRGTSVFNPYYSAMRDSNFYIAPLEEIKNNADLVVYWGCNPLHSTPRHLARYSVYPKGRCRERGSLDRLVLTVDIAQNEMSKMSREFLQVEPSTDFSVIDVMRRLLRGEAVEGYKGDIAAIENMVKAMTKASYGAVFFGLGLSRGANATRNINQLMALIKDLNTRTRFVILPLYHDYNASGAAQLLLRELGTALPADFSSERVTSGGMATFLDNLHEIDAVLIVGEDPFWSLPAEKSDLLREIPLVLIDPFWTRTTNKCQVVFPSAVTGVEAEGIAYRMDGLPIKLTKVLNSEYPSDESILEEIYQRLN
ncbi:MAG: formylmethanofuran dehydrogenase subunit B [Pseudomonadota bacterium]